MLFKFFKNYIKIHYKEKLKLMNRKLKIEDKI